MSDDHNKNIGWFLAGLGLGTVIAILYAPKSGRETRKAIVAGVDDGREYLVSFGRNTRRQISNLVASGKKLVTTKKRQGNTAVDAGREGRHGAAAEKGF